MVQDFSRILDEIASGMHAGKALEVIEAVWFARIERVKRTPPGMQLALHGRIVLGAIAR